MVQSIFVSVEFEIGKQVQKGTLKGQKATNTYTSRTSIKRRGVEDGRLIMMTIIITFLPPYIIKCKLNSTDNCNR